MIFYWTPQRFIPGRTGRRYGVEQDSESSFIMRNVMTSASQWWDHKQIIGRRYRQSEQDSSVCATPKSFACTVTPNGVSIFLATRSYINAAVGWRKVSSQLGTDIWEDIYQLLQGRIASVSVTHVYGHNKLKYNDAADALARAWAAKSTVHKTVRPRGPTDDKPRARRQKHTRARGVKWQATECGSQTVTQARSDRPIVIRHRRQGMRNAPMDIPDPEPNKRQAERQGTVYDGDPQFSPLLQSKCVQSTSQNCHTHEQSMD